ncbi:MAG TPA: LuxR C-terminal-related transcriptional regulator [Candidatus Sulfotelmatobacter sp.]|jgi:DNA-binding CsgD family transcriptional regulator|nr:LuxR C-terminal-related transcriptional regulator [Candidatus Sulfotelmatobacter sp.]
MKKVKPAAATSDRVRRVQAETRAEKAEARTAQARTRTEAAETRTEQAETRTEVAKSRTEQAESRTEQCEATMQAMVRRKDAIASLKNISGDGVADWGSRLQRLTIRQREILQLIAEGQNTKQIGQILKVSPKTVEYHRMRLMAGLKLHDITGLVRFALRAGLIPPEK